MYKKFYLFYLFSYFSIDAANQAIIIGGGGRNNREDIDVQLIPQEAPLDQRKQHNKRILNTIFNLGMLFILLFHILCQIIDAEDLNLGLTIIFGLVVIFNLFACFMTKVSDGHFSIKRAISLLINLLCTGSLAIATMLGYSTEVITDCDSFTGSVDCQSLFVLGEFIISVMMFLVISLKICLT